MAITGRTPRFSGGKLRAWSDYPPFTQDIIYALIKRLRSTPIEQQRNVTLDYECGPHNRAVSYRHTMYRFLESLRRQVPNSDAPEFGYVQQLMPGYSNAIAVEVAISLRSTGTVWYMHFYFHTGRIVGDTPPVQGSLLYEPPSPETLEAMRRTAPATTPEVMSDDEAKRQVSAAFSGLVTPAEMPVYDPDKPVSTFLTGVKVIPVRESKTWKTARAKQLTGLELSESERELLEKHPPLPDESTP